MPAPLYLVVTGGRNLADRDLVFSQLDARRITLLFHGDDEPLLTEEDEPAEPLLTEEDVEEYLLREEEHRKGLC